MCKMAEGSNAQNDDQFSDSSEQPSDPNQPISRPNFSRIEFPKLTDTHNIEYWFIRLESWFRLQGISDEVVRFEVVVASLTPQLFDQVVDIIIAPPKAEPYTRLKASIIEKFSDSEYTRVDKLLSTVPLGAQRPSHLPLAELSEMVDATFDMLNSENFHQVASCSTSTVNNPHQPTTQSISDPQDKLIKCIKALTNEMRANNNKQRSRSPHQNDNRSASRSREHTPTANRTPTCWYHRSYGYQARKCVSPCNFRSLSPAT